MQSWITYNDVVIKDVMTDNIDFQAVKESTGVDQLGVRVTGTFTGVISVSAAHTGVQAGTLDGSGNPLAFGNGLARVMQRLSKDRRRFTLKIGQSTLLDVGPGASEPGLAAPAGAALLDLENGPKPRATITKMLSGYSAMVQFTIEFVIPNCGSGGSPQSNGLINFRFWITEDVDCRTWLTIRRYQGRIRVANKNISPHALARSVTVPPLEDGFRRQYIAWAESENGLELDFAFNDHEMVAAPPWNRFQGFGAVDWHGRLSVGTNNMGATSTAELTVSLTGPKSTSIAGLEQIAFLVIERKLRVEQGVQGKTPFFWEFFGITEELDQNSIEVAARIQLTGNNQQFVGLRSLAGRQLLGQPMGDLGIGYDSNVAFNPGPSAGVGGLYLSALQLVCNPNKMPSSLTYATPPAYPSKRKKEKSSLADSSSGDFTYQSSASGSQLEAMYLYYLLDSEMIIDGGQIALPNGVQSDNKEVPSLSIVNLHRATAMREIRVDASRINEPPEIWDPRRRFADQNDIVHRLIGKAYICSSAPQVSADGRQLQYRTKMQVRYALSRPPEPGEDWPVGALPYRISNQQDPARVLASEFFVSPSSLLA